jgi:hypothetical protein
MGMMTEHLSRKREPRDLNVEPLRPGEMPIPGDTDSSFLESKHVILEKYENGEWGISHWTWPEDANRIGWFRLNEEPGNDTPR